MGQITRQQKSGQEPGVDGGLGDATGAVRSYWNQHIHDVEIAKSPVGTKGFFDELDGYRFEKLEYLLRLLEGSSWSGKRLLEVGCGVGTDLVRVARNGAIVTGVDLAESSIELAKKNFAANEVDGDLRVMDGENLGFGDGTFDVVYAHGVLQYTNDTQKMIGELHRVLNPGGQAVLMVYNRYSWLSVLSKVTSAPLEHQDAPAFKMFSIPQFKGMLTQFSSVEVMVERFPVKTRLHGGLASKLYNGIFVRAFNLIPRAIVRPLGWHILAVATK